MGITLAHYENEAWDTAGGTWSVDACWKTLGDDSTTEVTVAPAAGSTPADTALVQDHRYTITGLAASTVYSIKACSNNDVGDPLGCSDGSNPFSYTSGAAPAAGGTVGSVSSAASSTIVRFGDSTNITITATDAAGAVVSGAAVTATDVSTPVHCTLSPSSTTTDSSGNAVIAVTGTRRGTAKIDILCGTKGCKKWIWFCQKWYDYLLAMLRIPF